jgi:hypothetical protein
MTVDGITMRGGARCHLMAGRDGTRRATETNTINPNAGESFDVTSRRRLTGGAGSSGAGYDVYLLYNRAFPRTDNLTPAVSADRLPRSERSPERSRPRPCRTPEPWLRTKEDPMNRIAQLAAGGSPSRRRTACDRGRRAAADGHAPHRLLCPDVGTSTTSAAGQVDMTTDADYINLPDGNTTYMYAGKLVGAQFQHPSPVLRERGRRHDQSHEHAPPRRVDGVPRPGRRAWPTTAATPQFSNPADRGR